MTCYLIGGCIRTSWERVGMWTDIFSSHYARDWGDKIAFLMGVLAMADHPRWSRQTANIWYENLRMGHP